MLADEFIRKVWFPAGMVAVVVSFVLAFLLDDPVSDNVVGLIVGGTVVGLPVLYAVYRRVSGPQGSTAPRDETRTAQTTDAELPAGDERTAVGSRRI